MSLFVFNPEQRPFRLWKGPFSPARGKRSGFRFHQGRLGTWVQNRSEITFWPIVDGQGVRRLSTLVRDKWGGGRVLLLPNGFVIKPLQDYNEVGERVLIGRFYGAIVLERHGQSTFDMRDPGAIRSGDPWLGPATTGLECAIKSDGSLVCYWYHPAPFGREKISEKLRGFDSSLARGFRKARPRDFSGRVRVTANGHVITNRQERDGTWLPVYVRWVDPELWPDWTNWIG